MRRALERVLRTELGLPAKEAARSAIALTRAMTASERTRLQKKVLAHPVLSAGPEWVWVTPGNVPEPIALAVRAAEAGGARLTLKVSSKMTRTGRELVKLLRAPGQVIRTVRDPIRRTHGRAAWMIYGSDPTIAGIRRRLARGTRVGEMGDRFSMTVVFRSALRRRMRGTVRACARDIRTYDQKGCLSSRVLWVQGERRSAEVFGRALLKELIRLEAAEGSFRRNAETRSARAAFVRDLRVRSLDPAQAALLGPVSGPAPVLYLLGRGRFTGEGIGQVAGLKAFGGLPEVVRAMKPFWKRLQGIAVAGSRREHGRVVRAFRDSSAVYFCPAGKLQHPPVDWQL